MPIDIDKFGAEMRAHPPERLAKDGSVQKSKLGAEFRNKLNDWHERNKPQDELESLKAEEAELRNNDLI
jgi:hypothetical protein